MNMFNIIKTEDIKLMSSFIEGGSSSLKKKDKEILLNYKKNDKEYLFGDINIKLDDEQFEVVTSNPYQHIRVLAGAGSGKTTTLYTVLSFINSIDKNIMTLEDPVEYHIPLIRQSNIKADSGMDFASGVKAILRQDPDVILVGEIRDKDTAITAIQAAMTGHQVYTSLHANDALAAIPRLMNMGVPNYLMAGALIGVVAQRLARKLCVHCKKEHPVDALDARLLGPEHHNVKTIFKAVGCEKCNNSGYKGRVVVNEILAFDRELDDMVIAGASRKDLFKYATSHGFMPMVEDGLQKVIAGITDLKELMRTVDLTDRMN